MSSIDGANLDGMSDDELRAIVVALEAEGSDGSKALAAYGKWALRARDDRRAGRMLDAAVCEKQMDRVYESLPPELKW